MVWVCPYCQGTRATPPPDTGGGAVCPFCRRPVVVASDDPPQPRLIDAALPVNNSLDRFRKRRPRPFSLVLSRWLLIFGLVLAAALIGAGLTWHFLRQSGSQAPAPGPVTKVPSPEKKPPPPLRWSPNEVFVAKTLDQASKAVVKIEIPIEGGTAIQTGTGFFIGDRGWIATNYHLVQNMNSRSYVRSADGQTFRIAGVVGEAPEMDLAILALAERPARMTVLDLSYDGTPALGTEVYAFGHPYNVDFSLSRGVVSRVLTTAELLQNFPDHIVAKIRSPAGMIWIQHDAKTSPGNSGGPLLDGAGRVLGVNTFVHRLAQYGFASHIRYLRQLMQRAQKSTGVRPLPEPTAPPPESLAGEQVIDLTQLDPLWQAAESMAWSPQSEAEYQQLCELARIVTVVKFLQVRGQIPEGVPPEVIDQAAGEIDEKIRRLSPDLFPSENGEKLNRFVAAMLSRVHSGLVCVGTITGQPQGANALLTLGSTQQHLLLRLRPDPPRLAPGQRVLILGLILPQIAEVRLGEEKTAQQVPVILSMFVIPLDKSPQTESHPAGMADPLPKS